MYLDDLLNKVENCVEVTGTINRSTGIGDVLVMLVKTWMARIQLQR